jgi:hypothetical protein
MHACKLLRHQLANGDLERNTNRIDSVVEMENRENVGRGTKPNSANLEQGGPFCFLRARHRSMENWKIIGWS